MRSVCFIVILKSAGLLNYGTPETESPDSTPSPRVTTPRIVEKEKKTVPIFVSKEVEINVGKSKERVIRYEIVSIRIDYMIVAIQCIRLLYHCFRYCQIFTKLQNFLAGKNNTKDTKDVKSSTEISVNVMHDILKKLPDEPEGGIDEELQVHEHTFIYARGSVAHAS